MNEKSSKRLSNHQMQQIVRRTIGQWIGRKLRRKPMIIPVVVEHNQED